MTTQCASPTSPDAVAVMFGEGEEGRVGLEGGGASASPPAADDTTGEDTVVLDLGAMLMGVLTVSNGTPTHAGHGDVGGDCATGRGQEVRVVCCAVASAVTAFAALV